MHYEKHPIFAPPDDLDASIWRYIDFTKLVAVLARRSLHFARADRLGGQSEGSVSRANIEGRPSAYAEMPAEALAQIPQITRGVVKGKWSTPVAAAP